MPIAVWKAIMLGFDLNLWDYLTFLVIVALLVAFLVIAVFVLGLPGRIAIARKHPDAEAVNLMGWLGFLAVVPWMQAFIWAFSQPQWLMSAISPSKSSRTSERRLRD